MVERENSWRDKQSEELGFRTVLTIFAYPLIFYFLNIVSAFLFKSDFTGIPHTLILLCCIGVWLVYSAITIPMKVFSLRKHIKSISILSNKVIIQCYLGRAISLLMGDINSVESKIQSNFNACFNLLSRQKANYFIKANSNTFIISGDTPDIQGCVSALEAIVAQNKLKPACAD